jgi:hypothetical protein
VLRNKKYERIRNSQRKFEGVLIYEPQTASAINLVQENVPTAYPGQ